MSYILLGKDTKEKDQKAAYFFKGLRGAYYNKCHLTKKEASDIVNVIEGIPISRSLANTQFLLELLTTDKDVFEIQPNDYANRAGVMG